MTSSNEKYEKLYIKVFWAVIAIVVLDILFLNDNVLAADYNILFYKFSIVGFVLLLNIMRTVANYYNIVDFEEYYFFFRLGEIFSLLSICLLFDTQPWLYMTLVFPIAITSICKGVKQAVTIAIYSFLMNVAFVLIFKVYIMEMPINEVLKSVRDFIMYYFFSVLVSVISVRNLGEKEVYDAVENDIEMDIDMDISYCKLMESNQMLEDSNTMLAESNAELFTVQYIVRDINSILNIKDLTYRVNDIILGIMGASNVSILFLDNEKKRFKLYGNTIKSREEQFKFLDNINCESLFAATNKGSAFYDNFADNEKYPFLRGRNVGSVMLVPMCRDSKKAGIAIIEHYMTDYFSDDKLRFMEVVGQQALLAFEKVELYNRVLDIAVRDGLTGVYNRVYFQQKLNEEIKRAKISGFDLTLVLLDIDHFKGFNDTYGHTFGDKVIKHTVEVVKASLRKGDVIARFGGEEFMIILPAASSKEAFSKIERVRQALQNTSIKDNEIEASITASFGIASFPNSAISDDELIRAADEALYDAKNAGRNCVKVFSQSEAQK